MCTKENKDKHGKKVAGCSMICTVIMQAIWLGVYTWIHFYNPDRADWDAGPMKAHWKTAYGVDKRPHCCVIKKNLEIKATEAMPLRNVMLAQQCPVDLKIPDGLTDQTALYLLYFRVMWWLCLVGIFTSGCMILACCIDCCAHVANFLSVVTGLCQFVMLIGGSVFRFGRAGMACAVNGTALGWQNEFSSNLWKSGLGTIKQQASKAVDKVMASTGLKLGADNKAKKVDIHNCTPAEYKADWNESLKSSRLCRIYIWFDTAKYLRYILFITYATIVLQCISCICSCGATGCPKFGTPTGAQ